MQWRVMEAEKETQTKGEVLPRREGEADAAGTSGRDREREMSGQQGATEL